MSDELLQQLIKTLKAVNTTLLDQRSDYCETDEACRIIGVNNNRYLAQLFKRNLLPRYSRADGFVYKKSDCYKVAAALDSKTIFLEPLNKR